MVDSEDSLVKTIIHTLQHRVIISLFAAYREVLLYTQNAVKTHVLSNLDGIRTPRSNHLTAWSHIVALQCLFVLQVGGIAIEPTKFVDFRVGQCMIDFCGNHAFGLSSEEKNHSLYIKFGVTSVCKDTIFFGYTALLSIVF